MLNWMRKRRPNRPAGRRARLGVESLEERAVPAAAPVDLSGAGAGVATVFVESNDPEPGHNAVLAFHRRGDGSLQQIGTFSAHGTGQVNLPKVIGPDDSSQEVVATPDGRFLFAVNQGSNTVAAFRIRGDGRLDFIDTFDSGGVQPDSLGIAGGRLSVSNRGDSAVGHPGTVAPNITGFDIRPDGSLSPIPNSTVSFPVDTSPSQNLISRDGRFLFADVFGVPGSAAPEGNTFAPFQIRGDGLLQLAPGGNVGAPVSPNLLLGAAANPRLNIVYAGLTGANEVGVFTYDETGRLSFVTAVPDQGQAACWCAVSPDGKFLYTGDTGSNSVGVFSLADPLHPVELQNFVLGGPQAPPGSPRETAVFQVAVDPSGRFVYAVNQNTSPQGTFQEGNQLHILSVAGDGTLSEPRGPIIFAADQVPGTAHPQGIAVVAGPGRGDGPGGDRDGDSRPDAEKPDKAGTGAGFSPVTGGRGELSNVVNLLSRDRRDRD
jgi:6-phosphogluconolactonase (cycloisomerase 2 family)